MKPRNPLVIVNGVLIASLFYSLICRGSGIHGTTLLGLTDVVSAFGILAWLLIGAVWVIEQAKGGAPPTVHNTDAKAPEKALSRADASPVNDAIEAPPNAASMPTPSRVSRLGDSLMSVTTVLLAAFSIYHVMSRGIILGPLLLLPYWAILFGGQGIFRAHMSRANQVALYLAMALVVGPLLSAGLGQLDEKMTDLVVYAVEAVCCFVALVTREPYRADPSK